MAQQRSQREREQVLQSFQGSLQTHTQTMSDSCLNLELMMAETWLCGRHLLRTAQKTGPAQRSSVREKAPAPSAAEGAQIPGGVVAAAEPCCELSCLRYVKPQWSGEGKGRRVIHNVIRGPLLEMPTVKARRGVGPSRALALPTTGTLRWALLDTACAGEGRGRSRRG